jgi:hypothetical protein
VIIPVEVKLSKQTKDMLSRAADEVDIDPAAVSAEAPAPDLCECDGCEIKRLTAENERRRRALDSLSNVTALGNLLAVIHRDGGHHTEAVGVEQSVADAHKVWADLISALEDITGAAEEAWGPDRPCVKFARAALKEPRT